MASPFAAMVQRREFFRFAISDPTEAQRDLDEARAALRALRSRLLKPSDEELEAAEAEVAECRERYDACFSPVAFDQNSHAVQVYEQLRVDRGKRFKNKVPRDYEWWTDPDGAELHLIAECATDLGWDAKQWASELAEDRWTVASRSELLHVAMLANNRIAYQAEKD